MVRGRRRRVQAAHSHNRHHARRTVDRGGAGRYRSGKLGNRDTNVFDCADEVDITRKANPHLGSVRRALLPGRQPGAAGAAGAVEELLSDFGKVRVVRPAEFHSQQSAYRYPALVVELR